MLQVVLLMHRSETLFTPARMVLQRLINALRKLRAGVSLFGENVSPAVRNDLFRAHASIYYFFSRYATGCEILEVGCGTGYGAPILLNGGAHSVVALDLHSGNIRYARRHFTDPRIGYRTDDAQELPVELGMFDLIVSSNVFEHLTRVDQALAHIGRHLRHTGTFLLAVPPIIDEAGLWDNLQNPYHHSNFYVHEWLDRLKASFHDVRLFAHRAPEGIHLDFGNPFPSNVDPNCFQFVEQSVTDFMAVGAITAIFVCDRPR